MATVRQHTTASPEAVFACLAEGWLYSEWVVGTSHVRAVEGSWPRPGSRLHHASGAWPLVLRDETVVDSVDPPRRLELTAQGFPFGTAKIVVELAADATGTSMALTEHPCDGPARWLHNPVLDRVLSRRNVECLARLGALAERRTRP